ncbi:MAG: ribosome biogenesis factor YjgA [Rudaea sp.]|uniref:ribosome biogenesis factor YjgA n=1 Tax=Rudaea sp. TaxID=2136325 RepID=UPI0039E2A671
MRSAIIDDMPTGEHELNPAPREDGGDAPSRSQLRREALDVLKLAQALVELTDVQLGRIPLEDDLRDEVRRARAVTQQIARKRQTQFLAKQMRKLDDAGLEPIRAALEQDKDAARREAAALHRTEQWRERLVDGGDEALNEFIGQHAGADRQRLRTLARQARAERERGGPPHAGRELFRAVRELLAGK